MELNHILFIIWTFSSLVSQPTHSAVYRPCLCPATPVVFKVSTQFYWFYDLVPQTFYSDDDMLCFFIWHHIFYFLNFCLECYVPFSSWSHYFFSVYACLHVCLCVCVYVCDCVWTRCLCCHGGSRGRGPTEAQKNSSLSLKAMSSSTHATESRLGL